MQLMLRSEVYWAANTYKQRHSIRSQQTQFKIHKLVMRSMCGEASALFVERIEIFALRQIKTIRIHFNVSISSSFHFLFKFKINQMICCPTIEVANNIFNSEPYSKVNWSIGLYVSSSGFLLPFF